MSYGKEVRVSGVLFAILRLLWKKDDVEVSVLKRGRKEEGAVLVLCLEAVAFHLRPPFYPPRLIDTLSNVSSVRHKCTAY